MQGTRPTSWSPPCETAGDVPATQRTVCIHPPSEQFCELLRSSFFSNRKSKRFEISHHLNAIATKSFSFRRTTLPKCLFFALQNTGSA